MSNIPVSIVGMAWYRREDYSRIKAIMVDSAELPNTYDKWRYLAEKAEKQLKRRGLLVERVYIDPQEFPSWCRARGMAMNAGARSAFASESLGGEHRDQS